MILYLCGLFADHQQRWSEVQTCFTDPTRCKNSLYRPLSVSIRQNRGITVQFSCCLKEDKKRHYLLFREFQGNIFFSMFQEAGNTLLTAQSVFCTTTKVSLHMGEASFFHSCSVSVESLCTTHSHSHGKHVPCLLSSENAQSVYMSQW